MSVTGIPSGFDLYDFITRLIPGSVVAMFFMVSWLGIETVTTLQSSEFFIIGMIIFSYITGESIDHGRRVFFPVPNRFHRLIYFETMDEDMLGRLDRIQLILSDTPIFRYFVSGISKPNNVITKLDIRILSELNQEEDGLEQLDIREIYFIFRSICHDSIKPSTKRYRSIYIFVVNMHISSVVAGGLLVYGIYAGTSESITIPALGMLIIPMILTYIVLMFKKIDHDYIDQLCIDYFTGPRKSIVGQEKTADEVLQTTE